MYCHDLHLEPALERTINLVESRLGMAQLAFEDHGSMFGHRTLNRSGFARAGDPDYETATFDSEVAPRPTRR